MCTNCLCPRRPSHTSRPRGEEHCCELNVLLKDAPLDLVTRRSICLVHMWNVMSPISSAVVQGIPKTAMSLHGTDQIKNKALY